MPPLVFALALLASTCALAETLTIVTPYCGPEESVYADDEYGLRLKDTGMLKGLYVQSVNPATYQWNAFLYQTNDINYSDVTGLNFIYDRYFGVGERAKNVAGAGMNYLKVDLAGEQVPTTSGPLDAFTLDLDVASFYARVGRQYRQEKGAVRWTALPWIGCQVDRIRGDGLADFPGPGSAPFKFDEDRYYTIAGVNLKTHFRHFLQAEVKHSVTVDHNDCFHKTTVMLNFFMTRNVGLSYRYCRQETFAGTDTYGIFGIAAVF